MSQSGVAGASSGGFGNVTGPGSSTNMGVATWNGTGGTALNSPPSPVISSSGVLTNSNQPAFSSFLSGNVSNVTGDGTTYTVAFDSTDYNQGSVFNTSTATFTAPVTGVYLFTGSLYVAIIDPASDKCEIHIVTTTTTYYVDINSCTSTSGQNTLVVPFTVMCKMSSTNTATLNIRVAGGTKTIILGGLLGGSGWQGILLC